MDDPNSCADDHLDIGYDVYLVIHTYPGGETVNTILYTPTEDMPYPDVKKVAQEILLDVYDAQRDSVHMVPVDLELPVDLTAEKVGCRVFTEYHEGDV
jgi:hypothetical protein